MSPGVIITLVGCIALVVAIIGAGFAWHAQSIPWSVFTITSAVVAVVVLIVGIVVWNGQRLENMKTARGRGDAPRPTAQIIDGRAVDTVTEMPDGFGGVASKCVYEGVRAFITTRNTGYGSDLELWSDESCAFQATGPSK